MKIVTFLFPGHGSTVSGGLKVVCVYANRLVADGFDVHIAYSGSIFWKNKSLFHKITNVYRYIAQLFKGYSCRSWFPLDKRVKEHFSWSLNYRHVPMADVYIGTSPYTAHYLNNYPIPSKSKFYFIQGYENFGIGTGSILINTYHYRLNKIVIAVWLQRMLKESFSEDSVLIRNGFDFDYFRMNTPYELKDKYKVTILNHHQTLKGVKYGREALDIVKSKYPALRVNMFGSPSRPQELPDWYDYYQLPNREIHNRLYDEASIFLGTSSSEGWGLTIGEAMICGQAVVCTDNNGYKEMAIDGETALLSPIEDAQGLANNIIRLIEDDELRIRIAKNGHQFIQQFNWDDSYQKFKHLILGNM